MKSIEIQSFISILLIVTTSCFAQNKVVRLDYIPVYTVHLARGPITIDGELKEEDWQLASETRPFVFPWPDQPGIKQKTTVKILWDKDNLYVAYICEDTEITAKHLKPDSRTFEDDCVELFINPNPSRTECYYGLEMNCRGVLCDFFLIPKGLIAIKEVNLPGVKLATSIRGTLNKRDDQDKGWVLELLIPFKDFSFFSEVIPPHIGSSWRINLNRWDGKEKRCLSQWSASDASEPNPHTPQYFGVINFSEKISEKGE